MKILVTGIAGFIGMHCARRLLARGDEVIGIDNLSLAYIVPPPPGPRENAAEPMSGALLLGGLGTLWFARRRRGRA